MTISEVNSESSETSKMEYFAKKVKGWQLLIIFERN